MKKPNSSLITKFVIAGIGGIVLVVATFTVPRRTGTLDIGDRGLKGGPDSYLRHIYDPQEKRIRAEVGYGYEDVLTDIGTKHLIENTMVQLLRSGQTTEAVEAAARALQENLAGKNATHREKSLFAASCRVSLPS